jgi:hypothetical protein
VATGLLTLGMALPWPATWPLLRFAAGVASAVVFVYTSGWCLAQLARLGASATGGAMYTGPGAGIVISGLFVGVMIAWHRHAAEGWLVFGVLSFALTATVWRIFRTGPAAGSPAGSAVAGADASREHHGRAEVGWLAFAYGLAGFGYIITATFLPVIARGALPGSPWLDFFWPIFGLGVIAVRCWQPDCASAATCALLLAGAYAVQALGIGVEPVSPTLAGFALGSLLLGLPFTMITFFAMQEVRRLRPSQRGQHDGAADRDVRRRADRRPAAGRADAATRRQRTGRLHALARDRRFGAGARHGHLSVDGEGVPER